ncbi:hypothetical protein B296_00004244 [Ensete ventricosum]|uniref:Uncharacterized protein n=1 Tax=Ensete ventricosum TaxID=4639 RepID=A0A427B4Z8_ENSVE|nr:hypothetical protein B296_00004244 [Ensete ventricosum]
MIALYTDGSPTTTNEITSVFDLGSSPTMIGRVVVLRGEMESPMNLVNAYVMETRSLSVNPNFLKALRYKMSVELLVSTMILLTRVFAIRAEITKVSSWSRYSSFPDQKVISGSRSCLGLFSTIDHAVCFDWVREPEEPLSILLLGGPEGCPRDCSVRGRF